MLPENVKEIDNVVPPWPCDNRHVRIYMEGFVRLYSYKTIGGSIGGTSARAIAAGLHGSFLRPSVLLSVYKGFLMQLMQCGITQALACATIPQIGLGIQSDSVSLKAALVSECICCF